MATQTATNVTVRFDPTSTSIQADIIGPATSNNAGVMTAAQAAALAALLPMTGEIVKENYNTWVDAVNGNDENDGRTEATAFKTITRAFADQPVAWFKDNLMFLKPGSYDLDEGSAIFDGAFGGFVGDTGSPLAIIAVEPQEFLADTQATAGTAATITDGAAAWVTNQFRGLTVEIVSGAGAGQRATIQTNTGTVLQLARSLSPAPNATSVFRIIGPSTATEIVSSNAAVVFPFSVGGIGFRDLQIRTTIGAIGVLDGTQVIAMSGCKIDLATRNINIRRNASIGFTGIGAQWENSDQGIPIFPSVWDCGTYVINGGIQVQDGARITGGLVADDLTILVSRFSSIIVVPSFLRCTVTASDGGLLTFNGSTAVPAILDAQKTASATTGIVNVTTNGRFSIAGATTIRNSGGHGVLVDTQSYANLTGGVLSGTGNTGTGVKLDRGSALDITTANLPTIGNTETRAVQIGANAVQTTWTAAGLNVATTVTDLAAGTPTLCRATSR